MTRKISLRLASFAMLLPLFGLAVGCGQKLPDGIPALQSCTITVKMDGVPLENANVHLKSEAAGSYFISGATDGSGQAVIQTNGVYSGAPEGSYKITVDKFVSDPNWKPKNQQEQDAGETLKSVVDAQYSSVKTTPLECQVVKGANRFEFDVESAK